MELVKESILIKDRRVSYVDSRVMYRSQQIGWAQAQWNKRGMHVAYTKVLDSRGV